MLGILKKIFGTQQDRQLKRFHKTVQKVNECEESLKALSDEELKAKTEEFKKRFQEGESVDDLLVEAYAVVKNGCRRMQGTPIHVSGYDQLWDMVPYDVQILSAIAMHQGSISQMQTGEGKTLTAVLPLYLNALTGKPVHLVTVNDYLANRDCEWVGSLLRFLGLTTGVLTNDVAPNLRKEIYKADVVYGTASEFGFDYLRDNSMASHKDEQVQRGFYFAIIDEVDSILIDEARTPLIISGPVPESRQMYGELKGGVGDLVKKQRDLCSRIASDTKKKLDQLGSLSEKALSKQEEKEEFELIKQLWLVGKGTPNNKILKKLKEEPKIRTLLEKCDLHFHTDQSKEEKAKLLAQLFLTVDERGKEFELTDKGIHSWPDCTGGAGSSDDFVMLDISDAYLNIDHNTELNDEEKMEAKLKVQTEDAQRKERAHNLRQLLRAHLMMERDVDYIVQEAKVVIIDENTGRPQPGRRFSDGLHQAIEAKEGVEIQKETQTYATVTLQNYFRMYDKISGMTGTATTEAQEFKEIYKLEVLEIPTNKKCQRIDENDEIYMTEREKYNAILKDIREKNSEGRPILVGTESVEISEKLSRILRQNQIEHSVLNAKHHEREAEVIAHAGKRAAVTIATNMAGRGTDIKLEKGIAEQGGLFVLASSRHQSRRIDRQLRGRCARQGDPGSSKFFLSFEDELLRLFASSSLSNVIQRFRPPEGEPITAKMLNRSIETAQKRIEMRNYTIRKHTLQYDDVMNKQRQEIYAFRNEVLHTDKIQQVAHDLLASVISVGADQYFVSRSQEGGWNPEGFRQWLMEHFPASFEEGTFDDESMDIEELEQIAIDKVIELFDQKIAFENEKIQLFSNQNPLYSLGRDANEVVRDLTIRTLDKLWIQHLLSMDHLRTDVMLRTVAQKDPLMEFKEEAFNLFEAFFQKLNNDIALALFRFQIVPSSALESATPKAEQPGIRFEKERSLAEQVDARPQNGNEASKVIKLDPIKADPKVGRNNPCPCGSGKKYKSCCGVSLKET